MLFLFELIVFKQLKYADQGGCSKRKADAVPYGKKPPEADGQTVIWNRTGQPGKDECYSESQREISEGETCQREKKSRPSASVYQPGQKKI